MRRTIHALIATVAFIASVAPFVAAQGRGGGLSDSAKTHRWAVENELQSLAAVDRKEMIPMRDGIRIAADVYYPKDASKKYPAIWSRTPYNFN